MIVRRDHPRLMRYAFAGITVCLLTWFEVATWPLFALAPYLPIVAGVVLAAMLAGPGPGIFATALGIAAARILPLVDRTAPHAYAPLAAFIAIGAGVSVLSHSRHLSRGRLRRILEGVPDGCALLGPDWKFRFVNDAAAGAAGRPAETCSGRSVAEVFPHLADLPALREVRRAMDEGIPGRIETWYRPHERWYETNLYPVEEGVMILTRDVTDRRRSEEDLRESERRLRAIFDQTIAGIAQIDLEGRFRLVNERFCEIVGRSAAELAGCTLEEVTHPDDRSAQSALFAGLVAAGGDFVTERRYVRPNGGLVWVRTHVSAVRDADGTPRFCFTFAEEITERKRAEAEKDEALRRERAARAEAEAANRAKDEFLAVASHELRTPLTAITGWLRLLRLGAVDAASTSRALDTVERNAGILSGLVGDLLDASRIASGKLKLEIGRVRLDEVITAALDVVRPAAESKQIRIDLRLSSDVDAVLGDAARLQQVVWNLLSNAVKFTPPQGVIEVTSGRRGGWLSISVADSGPGIAPELLPRLFERFSQGESAVDRRHSGLGLGLSIVRHLVEMHGGSVRAESPGPERGTRFTVLLPPCGMPESHPRSDGAASANGRVADPGGTGASVPRLDGIHVLLVEDEEDTRKLVQRILTWRGAEVRVCASVREARAAFQSRRPDVIVSDIGLPEESGYALIQTIRSSEHEAPKASGTPAARRRTGHVPAIALTAFAQEIHRLRALASGYDAHVTKPVDPEALVRAVAMLRDGAPMGR